MRQGRRSNRNDDDDNDIDDDRIHDEEKEEIEEKEEEKKEKEKEKEEEKASLPSSRRCRTASTATAIRAMRETIVTIATQIQSLEIVLCDSSKWKRYRCLGDRLCHRSCGHRNGTRRRRQRRCCGTVASAPSRTPLLWPPFSSYNARCTLSFHEKSRHG